MHGLQALESQSRTQLRALEAGVAALQRQIPASAGGSAVSPEAFEKLASTTQAMQRSLDQMQSSGGKFGKLCGSFPTVYMGTSAQARHACVLLMLGDTSSFTYHCWHRFGWLSAHHLCVVQTSRHGKAVVETQSGIHTSQAQNTFASISANSLHKSYPIFSFAE